MSDEAVDDVETRLDELERQSELRRRELRRLATQVPVSRRAMIRALGGDLRHAQNKADLAGRAVRKALRRPATTLRRAWARRRLR